MNFDDFLHTKNCLTVHRLLFAMYVSNIYAMYDF